VLRSGRSRRRFLALSAYYALAFLLVGPMWFAPVEADTKPRIPVLISLNVALRTRTTDVATFTTPFPITVGVAGDGTFTIPQADLGFALVDVPLEAAHPGLGRLSVRAEAASDFGGTVDTRTGEVTLAGFLEMLWTRPHPRPNQLQMVDCPVGPFALHLSTRTLGGSQLARHPDPSAATARLVDDNLAINAIPPGLEQCAGAERTLNQALSLPIVPRLDTTTSTSTSTTFDPSTTTTSEATTTTTVLDPNATTTTVDPTATTIESTTTTTVAADPVMTPNAAPPDAADLAALAAATPPSEPRIAGGPGTELDPSVLSLEPIPSMVSTLTIAAVPPDNSGSTPTTQNELTPSNTPTTHATTTHSEPRSRQATAAARAHSRKHKPNKHAQTTADESSAPAQATPVANPAKNRTPPLYFSPLNFGAQKASPHNRLLTPAPIIGFGADAIAKHHDIASIIFIAALILPLIAISGGLVAADFGARVPFFGRRRRRARSRNTPRLLP
jgi:hypothetical protein